MVVCVAISGRWLYAVLNLNSGKLGGRGQEIVLAVSVAFDDHVMGFGQTISRVCTNKMCAHMGPRIVDWNQHSPPRYPVLQCSPVLPGGKKND